MAQYDCALCHLPTPSPLLLLSHLEVLMLTHHKPHQIVTKRVPETF